MNKKVNTEKEFDTIKFFREVKDTQGMSFIELKEYFKQKKNEFGK